MKTLDRNNIILQTDSYKLSHKDQYPIGTEKVYSYLESRQTETDVCFFGLQAKLINYLTGARVTEAKIQEAQWVIQQHMGPDFDFTLDHWRYILENCEGKLPLRIKAVPEGTIVNGSNVLMTIENTDPNCAWLTNYVETILSHLWYTTTVATNCGEIKKVLVEYQDRTCDETMVDFSLHNFGYRGVTCEEQAGLGDLAHLVHFRGSDTLAGFVDAINFYDADPARELISTSVPATEHSTTTIYGKDNECGAYQQMLDTYPTGILSLVSDSYDIYNAVENIFGEQLKDQILKRDGKLVIRPDSGCPVEVNRKLLNIIWGKFGGTTNDKGFKVFNEKIGLLQGDGIDKEMLTRILEMCVEEGFATSNIVFGSGGGLMQKGFDRDTFKFAIKCSYATINGEDREVQKAPITDTGKRSKAGRLKLVKQATGSYQTVTSKEPGFAEAKDELVTVFENGDMVTRTAFTQIRNRAEQN